MRAKPISMPLFNRLDTLFILTVFMGFIAAIALACTISLHWVSKDLTAGLKNRATIYVPFELDTKQTMQAIGSISEIKKADILSNNEVRGLLKPWVEDTKGIDLPHLIALQLSPNADIGKISSALPDGVHLETHKSWLGDVLRIIFGISALSALVLIAIIIASMGTIAAIVKARLTAQNKEISLLYTLGANDKYISFQFTWQSVINCFIGAFVGAMAGAGIIYCAQSFAIGNQSLNNFEIIFIIASISLTSSITGGLTTWIVINSYLTKKI